MVTMHLNYKVTPLNYECVELLTKERDYKGSIVPELIKVM
jgi:hypothetical protein